MNIFAKEEKTGMELCVASAYGSGGYAVPVRYVVKCISALGSELKGSSILIDNEQAKILKLCQNGVLEKLENRTVMCVLCRNKAMELIAIFMGNHYHGHLPYLITLPLECDLKGSDEDREVGCSIYAYRENLPSGEELFVLHP